MASIGIGNMLNMWIRGAVFVAYDAQGWFVMLNVASASVIVLVVMIVALKCCLFQQNK
jgi:hypothetical protein